MAIEHLSNEQLLSIIGHSQRRQARYAKMMVALKAAMQETMGDEFAAISEMARRYHVNRMRNKC